MKKMPECCGVECSKCPASIVSKENNDDCDFFNDYVYGMLEDVFVFMCEVVEMGTNDVSREENNL